MSGKPQNLETRRVYEVSGKYTLGEDEAEWMMHRKYNTQPLEDISGVKFNTNISVAWNHDAQDAVDIVKEMHEKPGCIYKRGEYLSSFKDSRMVSVDGCKFITEFTQYVV